MYHLRIIKTESVIFNTKIKNFRPFKIKKNFPWKIDFQEPLQK